MHLHRILGLTLFALSRPANADSSATSLTLPVLDIPSSSSVDPASASVVKNLRDNAADDDSGGEERAGLSEKLLRLVSSSKVTPDRLQKWLDEGKSAKNVFDRMRFKKSDAWLLHRPQFAEWLKYVDDMNAKNPSKKTPAISTLAAHYDDATLYKMISSASRYPSMKGIASRLEAEQMQHWVATAKSPDDVFLIMKLDTVMGNILSNHEFIAWSKYVDEFSAAYPEKSALMIPALVKYYQNDVSLFRVAESAKRVEETKSIATKLEDQLIQLWLSRRKSPDDVWEDFELGQLTAYLLENPLFSSWLKYANGYNSKFPGEKATAIETLTRKFDDVQVAKLLGTAKSEDSTRAVAMELETALFKMWLSRGKSAEDVYRLFRFDLVPDFTHNPLLHSWVSYVDMILKENPGKASAILSSLETRTREKPLNQILLEAMRFPSMEKAANAIQSQKIKSYLANNESPEHVFQWLNLDHVGDNLLIDPLFAKWLKYAKDFNKKNPTHQELFYSTIYRKYNSALIKQMIEMAMKNPSTVNVAKLIEKERAKLWLQEKEHPLRIFRELDLDWTREKTLASPNFKVWVKYLNAFNQRYPDEKTTMIDGLRAYYNDLNLVEMLHAAKQDSSTKKLATNLESALINKWVAKKELLDDLKRRFSHMRIADDVIERYAAKLNALAG